MAVFPVYKGAFERRLPVPEKAARGLASLELLELTVRMVQDFRTCLDYLVSRRDVDAKRVAYLGCAWGGTLGTVLPANRNPIPGQRPGGWGLALGSARPELTQVH